MLKNLILLLTPPADAGKLCTAIGRMMIARYEGLGPRGIVNVNGVPTVFPYICPTGHPTLGRGIVISFDEYNKLKDVGIPLKQAELDFKKEVDMFSREVAALIKVPTTDWEFDSLVSLAYNIGIANLKSSTLLRKLNLKDYAGAAAEFPKWVYGNHVKLPGLVTRREAEQRMFLNTPPRPVLVDDKVMNILARKDHLQELMAA